MSSVKDLPSLLPTKSKSGAMFLLKTSENLSKGNRCPQCNANNNELTSFPIMSNESLTFGYNDKLGVELEFKPRRKGS